MIFSPNRRLVSGIKRPGIAGAAPKSSSTLRSTSTLESPAPPTTAGCCARGAKPGRLKAVSAAMATRRARTFVPTGTVICDA